MIVAVTGYAPNLPGRARRAKAFGALGEAALRRNIGLFVTTPAWHVRPGELVEGWRYDSRRSQFMSARMRLPWTSMVIYDAMYLDDLRQFEHLYRRFRVRLNHSTLPSFNPVLPAKDVVYRLLLAAPGPTLLPQTWFDVSPSDVIRCLHESPEIWLKPTLGSGGRNMAFITKLDDDKYRVQADRFFDHSVRRELTRQELLELVRYARARRVYMAQENVPLMRTASGRKMDFRVTVARGDTGRWEHVATTVRFGAEGSELTNFHAGGEVRSLSERSASRDDRLKDIGLTVADLHTCEQSALRAALAVQRRFTGLALMGIDVGRAVDGRVYVYDCNGRPGRDILTQAEVNALMDRIAGYAHFVLKHRK